jgi:hypothetical protein
MKNIFLIDTLRNKKFNRPPLKKYFFNRHIENKKFNGHIWKIKSLTDPNEKYFFNRHTEKQKV